MQVKNNEKKFMTGLLFAVFAVLSVIGIWKTVYFSADIDESYALTMAVRIVSGDRMMLHMWEPHQMSAVLYAPLVACYKGVVGSMGGVLVFMRICGVFVQAGVSLFLYLTIRRYMPESLSMVLSFVYFNFTPKHIQSPEFSVLYYWAIMGLMLCMIRLAENGKIRWAFAAGISMSVIVLCYPTTVVLFLFVTVWMYARRKVFGNAAGVFVATCAGCGILFLAFLIARGGFDIFGQIPAILMDESHNQDMGAHIWMHLKGIWEILRIVLAFMVLCHVGRPVFGGKKKVDRFFFGILLLALTVYMIYQFHTIDGVNFLIVYPILLQVFVLEWYAYVTFSKTDRDKMWFEISCIPTTIGLVGILLSSNVITAYSVGYVMPGVILGAWQILRVYEKEEEAEEEKKKGARTYMWTAVLLLVCLVVQIFAARICLVRFTSTQRRNLFQPYYEVTHDVLSGIRLGDFDYIQYETKSRLLDRYVKEGDMFLYVGTDMFLYSQLDGAGIATGNTISTPMFGEQLMKYYETYPDRIPTVVFVDREYGTDYSQAVLTEPMKAFIETYFDVSDAVKEPAVTVFTRER